MKTVPDEPARMNVCVIIPTYNNAKTLKRVLDGVLAITTNVIIVNDGSTDTTSEILGNYPGRIRIDFTSNKGKGAALREGLSKAKSAGYEYAITIDSDGQHFASDIPKFIDEISRNGAALLIGSRNMAQAGIPKKSSFGNKFSNFWFWFETGIRLDDTQSGYRMYPLHLIPEKFYTRKFEFEIEIIVRSAWKGVPVKNIPIEILYDPHERVSHFRPFRDFTRISILNTLLVAITLLYIKPGKIIRNIKEKGIQRFFLDNVLEADDSIAIKSWSAALGIFIGIAPFWGFQTIIVIFLAAVLRLNKAIAFLFSNISIPPMIPFIIYASVAIGNLFLSAENDIFSRTVSWESLQKNLTQYLIGSFALAAISATLTGLLTFVVLSVFTTFSRKS